MTGDRGNDRDNRKIVGLGCPGRNIYITTKLSHNTYNMYEPIHTLHVFTEV